MNVVIYFVKNEFKNSFGYFRTYISLSPNQKKQKIFYRLTKESKYKFRENAIVTAKIIPVNCYSLKMLTSCELQERSN